MTNVSGWSDKTKLNVSVLASGFAGSVVAPGAVYCAEKLLPSQMLGIKKIIAQHIVQPHLAFFEKISKGITYAHERYDQRKLEQNAKLGLPTEEPNAISLTPEQRAFAVADTITDYLVALGSDFGGTYVIQTLINKGLNIKSHPFKIAMVDATLHLGGIALMPTLLAVPSENMHYGLNKMLRKVLGMDATTANEIAMPFTYVTVPGLASTLGALAYAHHKMR